MPDLVRNNLIIRILQYIPYLPRLRPEIHFVQRCTEKINLPAAITVGGHNRFEVSHQRTFTARPLYTSAHRRFPKGAIPYF